MNRSPAPRRTWFLWAAIGATILAWPQDAAAQGTIRSAPHDGYWLCFEPFYDGDFRLAAKSFREAAKGGIVNLSLATPGPWIDAICYHAMVGECHYQMGNLTDALDEYSAAIKFFLAHRNWMLQIDFPPGIEPEKNSKTNITWGRSSRSTTIGHFPSRYSSLAGRMDNQAVIRSGGVIAAPSYHPVYAAEIVRCTTLAISRRRELMGPVCQHDPLTAQLVEALARQPAPPNHWSQCWVQLELGLAYAAANRIPQAISELQKSLLAGGQFDHPLTCLALAELGRIAFEQGKYDAAATYFHEATISGAYFERYDVMQEAFRLGAEAHLLAGQKGVYAPLTPAIALFKKIRLLHSSLLISLADQLAAGGEVAPAANTLAQARNAVGRSEMAGGMIGCRLNLEAARVAYRSGEVRTAATALANAMSYQKSASKRLFQIGLSDAAFRAGGLTERIADDVFAETLREPTPKDWATETLDTLAALSTPHPLPYEHWFELVLARKDQDRAINIAERIRRHRFLTTQPLGGRLLALRWVLEAPEVSLTQEAILQRQDLLVKFPKFAELSRRSAELRSKLEELPLAPAEQDQIKQQQELLAELAKVSAAQEAVLQLIALERVPSDLAFPPLRETKEIQKQLPDGTIVFYYFATSRNVHAFAVAKDRYAYFTLDQPAKVKADLAELLKQMGLHDRVQPVSSDELKSNGWRPAAQRLLGQLTDDAKPDEWARYRELVIVPDGVLWYLPFEALPAPADNGNSPLIMQLPIRYVPTLALAIPDGRARRPIPRTALVAGRLSQRDDEATLKNMVEPIIAAAGNCTWLRKEPGAPSSVFASTFDRLIVLADSDDSDKQPLGWSPLVLDAAKPGGSVADWLQLPLAGIDQAVFTGFHTPAESGLKRGGTGEDIFLSVCGLMAGGCRTVLLSRWRVGGQSTADLIREFIQELPHQSAATAWRRSVQLASDHVLDPSLESRFKSARSSDGLKASHPFFWSGYLLIDTGVAGDVEAAQANN